MTVIHGLSTRARPAARSAVPVGAIVAQAFGNALVGIVLFQVVETAAAGRRAAAGAAR